MTYIVRRTNLAVLLLIAGLTAALFPGKPAYADERLDGLILCAAVFNASLARANNQALRDDYEMKTRRYANAAIRRAENMGMTTEGFQTRAMALGEETTISEDELPSSRARCLSDLSLD